MRNYFIFYRSFFEAINELDKDSKATLYDAICEYSLNKKEPEMSGICKTVWILIKPQIEANLRRFENGSKAKQKQTVSKVEAKPKRTRSKTEANINNNINNNYNINNNKKILFIHSPFFEKQKFKEALPEWSSEKLKHYYDALLAWSNEGNKKIDWIATARVWAAKDEKEGKVKFTPVTNRYTPDYI